MSRASVIYHDVFDWLESRIPPPLEYQDQQQPQGQPGQVTNFPEQGIEEPLDLRTYTLTVEPDTTNRIFSITKDVADLSVHDLSIAGSHYPTAHFTQAVEGAMENEPHGEVHPVASQIVNSMIEDSRQSLNYVTQQYEGCHDGRCDFGILLQGDIGCCRSVLEREDGYIYGSQPCKHDATYSTTGRSVVQPEQPLDARNGEHTAVLRLREGLVQFGDATEKPDSSYVQSRDYATRSSDRQRPCSPYSVLTGSTSDVRFF